MITDISYDIEDEIVKILKKRDADYLTVLQVKSALPNAIRNHLKLQDKKDTGDILKTLKPHISDKIRIIENKGRKTYIGFNVPLKEIVYHRIRRNPGKSAKQLAQYLPMVKKNFILCVNELLHEGQVVCDLNNDYIPMLKLSEVGSIMSPEATERSDKEAFKAAFDAVSKGQRLVHIHLIRNHLNWNEARFDHVLSELNREFKIQLHGGDPSRMTKIQIRDSFKDENGILHISISWRGRL